MTTYPSASALSIRQPWAWLILHGGKDIENRDWPTRRRGRVLIHTGQTMTRAEYEDACHIVEWMISKTLAESIPPPDQLPRGGIVGSVEIVDCVDWSESKWFFGEYGFVLRDATELPFQKCKGALSFFRPDLSEPIQGTLL